MRNIFAKHKQKKKDVFFQNDSEYPMHLARKQNLCVRSSGGNFLWNPFLQTRTDFFPGRKIWTQGVRFSGGKNRQTRKGVGTSWLPPPTETDGRKRKARQGFVHQGRTPTHLVEKSSIFSRRCHFQKSDPPEAAALLDPCLKGAMFSPKLTNISRKFHFSKV